MFSEPLPQSSHDQVGLKSSFFVVSRMSKSDEILLAYGMPCHIYMCVCIYIYVYIFIYVSHMLSAVSSTMFHAARKLPLVEPRNCSKAGERMARQRSTRRMHPNPRVVSCHWITRLNLATGCSEVDVQVQFGLATVCTPCVAICRRTSLTGSSQVTKDRQTSDAGPFTVSDCSCRLSKSACTKPCLLATMTRACGSPSTRFRPVYHSQRTPANLDVRFCQRRGAQQSARLSRPNLRPFDCLVSLRRILLGCQVLYCSPPPPPPW